jgi:hypothetical protein
LHSVYNFTIHLQFFNLFVILQSVSNFVIHLQFWTPFSICQSSYNFEIHLQLCNPFLQIWNPFTIWRSIYNLDIFIQLKYFQASPKHRATACSCFKSACFQRLTVRVARWFIFRPKIPIWVNFGGP